MFKHRISEKVGIKTKIDWFLLAFLAGAVNTGGWMGCHRFVSHVTGFATLAGVDAAQGAWRDALGILSVPIYFLMGVMVSAVLVDHRISLGKKPKYSLVMGIITLLLAVICIGGKLGYFGEFGVISSVQDDYLLLVLLCTSSGLQNAALSTATGATVRTTHLTGITTDLGIGLVRVASLGMRSSRVAAEIDAIWARIGSIFSFMIGSGIAAVLYLKIGYLGFVLPAGIALYATVVAFRDSEIK